MSNVSHLRGEEKKRLLSKTYGNSPILYLDCGVFQKFKSKFSETEIVKDREKLIRLFNILQPKLASAFDIPSLIWHNKEIKRKRIRWSIDNYIYMKNHVNRKIHLVPGVCAFSEKSVEIVTKIIRDNIGDPIVLAIGGLVPMVRLAYSNPNLGWIAMYMVKLFREKFPQSHIHAYGVGGPKWYPLVRLLGANSADYAGFLQYTFKGKILLQDGRAGYISKKIKYKGKTISRNFEDVFLKSDLKMLHDCQCPICNTFPQKKLEKSYQPRLIHNLYQVISKSNLIDEKIQNNEIDDVKKIIKNRIIHPNKGDIPKQVLIKTLEFV